MTVLLIMIPLSLLFVAGAIAAFFWAVNHDQFDDMDSPALLPVTDDEPVHAPQEPLREPDASLAK
jgi:cbb3-type cytochrome oxidase maturation protein